MFACSWILVEFVDQYFEALGSEPKQPGRRFSKYSIFAWGQFSNTLCRHMVLHFLIDTFIVLILPPGIPLAFVVVLLVSNSSIFGGSDV
jgi:hypothetical protein